jgi:hypothetical protein
VGGNGTRGDPSVGRVRIGTSRSPAAAHQAVSHRSIRRTLPKPFSLVEIPVPQSSLKALVARRHAEFMLHSMAHYQPIVQGYSGIEPPGFEALERTLMLFPDEASLDTLAAMQVTYAVVHMDYFPPELIEYARTGLERFEADGRLRLVHTEGDGRVYEIVR